MLRYVAILLLVAAGCRPAPPPVADGPPSGPGWEVRYNAVLALAQRGSDQFLDPIVQDLVKEMLDEEQQLRNFRTRLKSGEEAGNPQAARMAVLGSLHAIGGYHGKKPAADLSGLHPAIQKLTDSANPVLAKEARGLLEKLSKSGPAPSK